MTEHATPHLAAGGMSTLLAGLYPPVVATVLARVGAQPVGLHPREHAAVAGAGPERRRQFLTGRACAHDALRRLGLDDGSPVGRGAGGEPLWPLGAVGSIAHTEGLAGAVVAWARDAWGLGLDLEHLDPPLEPAVERLVLTDPERAGLLAGHPLAPYAGKIAFCVKEAVYKALFPATRWRLEFGDVAVDVDPEGWRYRAVVDERFTLAGRPIAPLAGRLAVADGYVLAGSWVATEGPAARDPGAVTG